MNNFGPVICDGKALAEIRVYIENQDKVPASIGIPERIPDTYGQTIRSMRKKKLTFEQAIGSTEFLLVQKPRLLIVRHELFARLEQMPFA